MATQAITNMAQVCEGALRVMKAYNVEHAIWPSENIVIDRLLARRLELADAYAEIDLHFRSAWLKVASSRPTHEQPAPNATIQRFWRRRSVTKSSTIRSRSNTKAARARSGG